MPVFIAKYNEIRESKAKDFDDDDQGTNELDLLGTIRVPKNLRLLTERLPKSNFGGKEEKKDEIKIIDGKEETEKGNSARGEQKRGRKLAEIKEEEPEKLKISEHQES
jgi:hypothetical protein